MAGGYTHLTLVRSAVRRAQNEIPELLDTLDFWGRYIYLGGVSPDYPYLGLDADWADLMHKGKTDHMIATAMPALHKKRIDGTMPDWQQQFAWLLGFVSHIIADVTVHPIVNIRVGKYEENKDHHRICEMNQDVWIYKKITTIDLHTSDNMKGEIRSCGTSLDLNDGVEDLWSDCLHATYGQRPNSRQIDKWHASFVKLVDLAEVGKDIPVFGRHIVSGGYAYPDGDKLDASYFNGLDTPVSDAVDNDVDQQPKDRGDPKPFNEIFDKALDHILEAWTVLADDMFADEHGVGVRHKTVFGDWSLDTGIDNSTGKLRLWPIGTKLV